MNCIKTNVIYDGYNETQIMAMGRWYSKAFFKIYQNSVNAVNAEQHLIYIFQ